MPTTDGAQPPEQIQRNTREQEERHLPEPEPPAEDPAPDPAPVKKTAKPRKRVPIPPLTTAPD